MEQKFLRCSVCGNILTPVVDSGVPVMCCGKKMEALVPGTVDASHEKHIPVYEVENNHVNVKVGSVEHPMVDVHYIQWIAVQTNQGIHIKYLKPNQAPAACFSLCENETLEAVYEYCNLHGLWVSK